MPIFSRFGADFFTVYADFSRFIRDINGEKKNISLLMIFFTVSFSRFAPSRACCKGSKTSCDVTILGDRKGTTKKLCDKDVAERLGELSRVICLETFVSLGNDLVAPSNCSEKSLVLFVRSFGFVEPFSDLFSRRFREGISFPNFVERCIPELPLSKLCSVRFSLQNRALFEGEKRAKRCREKGRKRGGQQRGAKRKKGRVKTGQFLLLIHVKKNLVNSVFHCLSWEKTNKMLPKFRFSRPIFGHFAG